MFKNQPSIYLIQAPPSWLKTPPLSLLFLKSFLESKGIKVKILDLNALFFRLFSFSSQKWLTLDLDFEGELFFLAQKQFPYVFKNIYHRLKDVDYIGFSLYKRNSQFSLLLAEKIKELFPLKKIILGGPQTLFLERQKELTPDYFWVIGEGELPLYKVLNGAKERVYRFEEIEDLDSISPFDLNTGIANFYSLSVPLFSSRGCPYQCRFCSERLLYRKPRQHSVRYIYEQMRYFFNQYNRNTFIFCDSLINQSNNWLEDLCNLIIRNNLSIKWEAQLRITKDFSLNLARLLKRSGCYNLFIGLESGSDRVLNLMQKGYNTQIASSFLYTLSRAGLHFEVSLILGYPGEEENDFKETLNFILKHKRVIPKIAQANPFVDYLGEFSFLNLANSKGKKRLFYFLHFLEKEKIRYTKSFINNLSYF